MADLKLKMACKLYDRTLPFFLSNYWRQEREFFGDWDLWKMDFQHNYHILDALCQYGYEQRLVETRFRPEDIWVTGPIE